jgi:adenosine deaminase
VTLGTDDPGFFDTDPTRELQLAHGTLGLSLAEADRLVDAGLEAAFLPVDERAARLAAVRQARDTVRRELAGG